MDTDRVTQLLEDIRDLQRRLLDSSQHSVRNQQDAIQAQQQAIARARKLQVALGVVIGAVFVVVLVLLRYVRTMAPDALLARRSTTRDHRDDCGWRAPQRGRIG